MKSSEINICGFYGETYYRDDTYLTRVLVLETGVEREIVNYDRSPSRTRRKDGVKVQFDSGTTQVIPASRIRMPWNDYVARKAEADAASAAAKVRADDQKARLRTATTNLAALVPELGSLWFRDAGVQLRVEQVEKIVAAMRGL